MLCRLVGRALWVIWLAVCASRSYALAEYENPVNSELVESGRMDGIPGVSFSANAADLQITSLSPAAVLVGSKAITLTINGTGFASGAMVQIDLALFTPSSVSSTAVKVTLAASLFREPGNLDIAVENVGPPLAISNMVSLPIAAVPSVTSVSPAGAAIGSSDLTVSLSGTGFGSGSVVYFNGEPLTTTDEGSDYVSAVIPSSMMTLPGNGNLTVGVPGLAGSTSNAQLFTIYLGMVSNDIIYRPNDGYVYASIPGSAGSKLGNTIAAIDPITGVVVKTLAVGSEPNRLALSSDGKYVYVGLDAAGGFRRVDLDSGAMSPLYFIKTYFGLGFPAFAMAVMPGHPETVAIYDSEGTLALYDNGVERPDTTYDFNTSQQIGGYPAFDPTGTSIYTATTYGVYKLEIGVQGLVSYIELSPLKNQAFGLQYDAGKLYVSDGEIFDAATGHAVAELHNSSESHLVGPVISDHTVGKVFAFPFNSSFEATDPIDSFDEKSFHLSGSLAVGGLDTSSGPFNPADLIRWGENGLAFRTGTQIYFLRGPFVRDLSLAPASLALKWDVPEALTTGHKVTETATITNRGPYAAQAVTLAETLPGGFLSGTVTASRGSCAGAGTIVCDLGSVPAGSIVTVDVPVTATTAGTFTSTITAATESSRTTCTSCAATATTVVTGGTYSPPPVLTSISPSLVEAGKAGLELTMNGSGFGENSTALLNGKPLATTFVSATQLTAHANSTAVSKMGWASVQVSTAAPGGGVSGVLPLTIYATVDVAATSMILDPFTRKLYATVPDAALPGGVVAIDPESRSVGKPLAGTAGANSLAESSDGNNLYADLSNSSWMARIDLPQFKLANTIELPLSIDSSDSVAMDVQPGSDTTLVVGFGSPWGGEDVSVVDVNGSTATVPSGEGDLYAGEWPQFGDATHIYSIDTYGSPQTFYRITLNPEGGTPAIASTFGIDLGSAIEIGQDGLVYGASGVIFDGRQKQLEQIAAVPNGGYLVAPDTPQGRAFYMQAGFGGDGTDSVMRADIERYVDEEVLALPTSTQGSVFADAIVRWGQDGLAILSQHPSSNGNGAPEILLLRGPFVVPAEASVHAAPTLAGTEPASVIHESGNSYVTVVGRGFLPEAVVLWDGSPRTTTYLDSKHVKVAVPAADVAAHGMIHLTAENPGSGLSNSIDLNID
jgi:trimeric autotransporter adhesin